MNSKLRRGVLWVLYFSVLSAAVSSCASPNPARPRVTTNTPTVQPEKAAVNSAATPLLWTTNLMAPEAYVLSAAIDGWLKKESDEQIRLRAADAYNKYQNCGVKAARTLFATGW